MAPELEAGPSAIDLYRIDDLLCTHREEQMSAPTTKPNKAESRARRSSTLKRTLSTGIAANPEILLVLAIASRAYEIEANQPARNIGVATDIVAVPANSQCPV